MCVKEQRRGRGEGIWENQKLNSHVRSFLPISFEERNSQDVRPSILKLNQVPDVQVPVLGQF